MNGTIWKRSGTVTAELTGSNIRCSGLMSPINGTVAKRSGTVVPPT
jgi:hypothetical protein